MRGEMLDGLVGISELAVDGQHDGGSVRMRCCISSPPSATMTARSLTGVVGVARPHRAWRNTGGHQLLLKIILDLLKRGYSGRFTTMQALLTRVPRAAGPNGCAKRKTLKPFIDQVPFRHL